MKEKLELEYTLNTSPKVIFSRLSTPSGLSEWFAEDVNQEGNFWTFRWDSVEQMAEVINLKENKCIKYKWTDDEDPNSFFEFRIHQDDITGDLALHVTDFAETAELEEARNLWDSQISCLKRAIGL